MSPSGRQWKRALPGRSSLFWKSEPKSTRGCSPWTPGFIISARKDTLFLLSVPFTPAIELLYRQSLRRNYGSAIKPEFCGGSTCGNCTRPFLPDHLPRSGYFIFLVQQLQEAAFSTHLKLPGTAFQGSSKGSRGSCLWWLRLDLIEQSPGLFDPWCFSVHFSRKVNSLPGRA